MKIGIDLDGVLCDFVASYNALIKAHLGIELPYPAPVWDHDLAGGVTKEQKDRMGDVIQSTPFHGTMLPLPGALEAIERLNVLSLQANDIYFITSRHGELAKFWAEMWLRHHGMDYPTVLISKNKGPVALGLNLDVFVDDKPENNRDVMQAFRVAKQTVPRVYLPSQLYNEWADEAEYFYGVRVADLNEVLEREFPREQRRAA